MRRRPTTPPSLPEEGAEPQVSHDSRAHERRWRHRSNTALHLGTPFSVSGRSGQNAGCRSRGVALLFACLSEHRVKGNSEKGRNPRDAAELHRWAIHTLLLLDRTVMICIGADERRVVVDERRLPRLGQRPYARADVSVAVILSRVVPGSSVVRGPVRVSARAFGSPPGSAPIVSLRQPRGRPADLPGCRLSELPRRSRNGSAMTLCISVPSFRRGGVTCRVSGRRQPYSRGGVPSTRT